MNNQHEHRTDYWQVRHPDPPLTELGRQQAQYLAHWLAGNALGEQVTHVYSSLMTRAVQTAAPVAQALGLPVLGLSQAYECGGLNMGPDGQFKPVPGRSYASLLPECPHLQWPEELPDEGWDGGYEPWEHAHFRARAVTVAEQLKKASQSAQLMVCIIHHDFAQFLMAELLGLPQLDGENLIFHLKNTSTTCIRGRTLEDGTEQHLLQWLNRTEHLPRELITG